MSGTWHTDRKVGEIAVLPNGTRVRIVFIRGTKVRLEYINPPPHPESRRAATNGSVTEGRVE